MTKKLYLLSGLGADRRVYDALDLSDYQTQHVTWICPRPAESIQHYAARLREQIDHPKPVLVGVSFGGMMAIEYAKQFDTEKVVLISSAKTKFDIPGHDSIFKPLNLHRLIPSGTIKNPPWFIYRLFGVNTPQERATLRDILQDTDEVFFRWAIDQIVNWQNVTVLKNVVHIHGTDDRLLPYTYADCKIEGGGHLMIINKAPQVERAIKQCLQALLAERVA